MAFRKFAARRSLPSIMISDNGSTYLSAAEELRSLLQLPEIKEELAKKGVSWRFIPKRGPWYGRFWEHLIGLTKTAIKKVLGRRHVSLSTVETILVEIEAILNDRLLTFVSTELGDPEPLTPAHLLHGRRITCLPYQDVDIDELTDPTYRETSQLCKRARIQAIVLRTSRRGGATSISFHYRSTTRHRGRISKQSRKVMWSLFIMILQEQHGRWLSLKT